MRNSVFQYELRTWLRSPIFYLLAISFFLFSWLTMLGTGGYFDGPIDPTQKAKFLNSAYSLAQVGFLQTKMLLFVAAIIGGFSLYRDYKNKAHAFLYSYPISKSYYLNGKLGSAIVVLSLVGLAAILGLYLGVSMQDIDNPKIGPSRYVNYFVAFGLYLLPTLISVCIFVFVVVGITRNIFSAFIVVICLVLFQSMLENVLFNQPQLLAILDPFGQSAFAFLTNSWSLDVQNSSALPIGLQAFSNRAFWMLITLLAYFLFLRKFDFQYDKVWTFSSTTSKVTTNTTKDHHSPDLDEAIIFNFSLLAKFKATWHLLAFDFRSILKNWTFWAISAFGALSIFFMQLKVTNTGEFNVLPMTRIFIGVPLYFYLLIVGLCTFIFAGMLLNRGKQYQMNLMLEATPITNWQLLLSKTGAITAVQLLQLFIFLVISLGLQMFNGYYDFKLGVYLYHLAFLAFPILLVWNLTSQFVHSLFPNVFIGLFFLCCLWLAPDAFEQLGIESRLFKYNSIPAMSYTDFDGYGHQLKGNLLTITYWLFFAFILSLGTLVIWNRGSMTTIKERLHLAQSRMQLKTLFALVPLLLIVGWLAMTIFKAEQLDNRGPKDDQALNQHLEAYKTDWDIYSNLLQPKIDDIDLRLDMYPKESRFSASGSYQLVNKSNKGMDTIFVRTGYDEITRLDWNDKAQLVKSNDMFHSYLYKLENTLRPGDSVSFNFDIKNKSNTLFSRNSSVISEGTYMTHDFLPRFGYQFSNNEDNDIDSTTNRLNGFHRGADLINIQTTISTSSDQLAIAPGALISHKEQDGRSIYNYKSPKQVKLNFSFQSGNYEKLSENYKGLTIELYYKKGHEYNTKTMVGGLKAALDYNTKIFGDYPYDVVRIIEFPHTEGSYTATLMANNIPTSEGLFAINTEAMSEKINLPFYVMSHELTHEWFGNQLTPADAEGSKMLTESITEYLSLAIYREHFGEAHFNNFLKIEGARYKRGKVREEGDERPLIKVLPDQEYISYGKGAIAFTKIAEAIGNDKLNLILKDFLSKYDSSGGVYPTAEDFLELLLARTDEKHHDLINRWLVETGIDL